MKIRLIKSIRKLFGHQNGILPVPGLDLYRKLYSEDILNQKCFYNIGAGNFRHPFWTNVDGNSEYYNQVYGDQKKDIIHDLFSCSSLPVESNTAECIYSSHTIEHIDDRSVDFLLNDCYRMLRPGGVLRLVTPDIEIAYRALVMNDELFFRGQEYESENSIFPVECLNRPLNTASLTQIFIEDFAAGASELAKEGAETRVSDEYFGKLIREMPFEEVLNFCISKCSIELQRKYPFRHINWFSAGKLSRMLKSAGFNEVIKSGYMQSVKPAMRIPELFDTTMITSSLYMEAVK